MEMKNSIITGGVYLVLDPSMELNILKEKLRSALEGGVSVIQIWNNWLENEVKKRLIEEICFVALPYQVPVLINEDWELLRDFPVLSGIHFDDIPEAFECIKEQIKRPFICGITCSNDLKPVSWAEENDLDYISFCSMFPSSSADSCEIVMPENVRKARAMTDKPIFLAGGVTPDNIPGLKKIIPFDGIAAISGIMNDDDPRQKVSAYLNALQS